MRGPVGLLSRPEEECEYERFAVSDEEGTIDVWIDPRILASSHLKRGTLLVSIEGYGRFRFHLQLDEGTK